VARTLSVELPTVELSVIFLAVALLIAIGIAASLARYILFLLRCRTDVRLTPESKLDWLLRSIRESAGAFSNRSTLYSITNRELRGEFEKATFGSLDPTTSPSSMPVGLKKVYTKLEQELWAEDKEKKSPSLGSSSTGGV
jgi:hypothetical protein